MEPTNFDDQIFGDFGGPLSPLAPKAIQAQNNGHSIHVMLTSAGTPGGGGGQQSSDMCNQRLPEVHSLLPGSPKLEHYKNLDYTNGNKLDYGGNKIGSYSPTNKYDYVNVKIEQQYNGSPKLDYGKPIEYSTNNGKMNYDHIQIYQQQQQSHTVVQSNDQTMNNGMNNLNMKKKTDEMGSPDGGPNGSITSGSSDGSNNSSTKKTDNKKKNDPNGIKKKKTR